MQLLERIQGRLIRGKHNSLNELDRKLEKYVDFDNGYFVELGANDGVTQSNSSYFEKHRGWRGLLVEPKPHNFLKCRKNRATRSRVRCVAFVAFGYEQEFVRMAYSNLMSAPVNPGSDITDPVAHAKLGGRFSSARRKVFECGAVACTLNDLLLAVTAPVLVDFLSLDVESAKLEWLKEIDHERVRSKHLSIDHRDFPRLNNSFKAHGFTFVVEVSGQDCLFTSTQKGVNGALTLDGET